MQSSPCVSCGQDVINALFISMTLRGQILTRRVVFPKLGSEDRSEAGKQIVVPLAKEACSVDFPGHSIVEKCLFIALLGNDSAVGHLEVVIWIVIPYPQEALSAVSVLLREAAGGVEDVGESNH